MTGQTFQSIKTKQKSQQSLEYHKLWGEKGTNNFLNIRLTQGSHVHFLLGSVQALIREHSLHSLGICLVLPDGNSHALCHLIFLITLCSVVILYEINCYPEEFKWFSQSLQKQKCWIQIHHSPNQLLESVN